MYEAAPRAHPRGQACRASRCGAAGPTRAGRGSRRKARRRSTSAPYAAQIPAQLGAHVIKISRPKDFIEQAEAKKVFEKYGIPTKTLSDRVKHCIQSAFNGKRITIFSGGETKGTDELLAEVKELAKGAASARIMGRNALPAPAPGSAQAPRGRDEIYQDA